MVFAALRTYFFTLGAGPIIKDEVWYYVKERLNVKTRLANGENPGEGSVFSKYLTSQPILIEPVNRDFSIVIEKIGVNAPIVADVPVSDEEAYNESLKSGIAHAAVSDYPSVEPGNVYLFAHSSLDFWKLGKFATVFNLLRKLEVGDLVHVFYEDEEYIYKVVNKEILSGWNTYPITRPVIEPTLTLQTCNPPGTTINRLVVTANLIEKR